MRVEQESQEQINPKNSNIMKLLFISSSILLNQTGFNGAQNIITKVYEQLHYNNLGRYCFVVLYICFAFTNLAAPKIVPTLGLRLSLIISSFGYFLNLVAGIITCSCQKFENENLFYCNGTTLIYVIDIIINAITGLSAAILWNAYLKYVSDISNKENKGRFFGIFYGFQNSSLLTGNLLTVILFHYTDKFYFFLILSTFCLASCIMVGFLPAAHSKNDSLLQTQEQVEQPERQDSISQTMSKIIKFGQQTKIRPLLYLFYLTGLVFSFYAGFLFKIVDVSRPIESDETRNTYIGLVLLCAGTASLFSGPFIGKLFDSVTRQRIISLVNLVIQASLITSVIAYYSKNYILCFFASALWGVSVCSMTAIGSSLISKDFGGVLEGFALNQLVLNLGTFSGFFIQIIMNQYDPIYYIFLMFAAQALAGSQMILYSNDKKQTESICIPESSTEM